MYMERSGKSVSVKKMTGKIYKLTCETGKIYIGSTSRTLNKRLQEHKSLKNNCSSKDFINPSIELLEEIETENREELRKKEREYMEKIICVNKNKPICNENEKKCFYCNKILLKEEFYKVKISTKVIGMAEFLLYFYLRDSVRNSEADVC